MALSTTSTKIRIGRFKILYDTLASVIKVEK